MWPLPAAGRRKEATKTPGEMAEYLSTQIGYHAYSKKGWEISRKECGQLKRSTKGDLSSYLESNRASSGKNEKGKRVNS